MSKQLYSKSQLNAIATRALLDKGFQAALLNGHRKEMLDQFPLTEEERDVLLDLKVENVDHLITQLDSLMVPPAKRPRVLREAKPVFAL